MTLAARVRSAVSTSALTVLLGLVACRVDDVVALQQLGPTQCDDDEPALIVGDTPCTSGRSQQFRHAVCTCEGSVLRGPLTTSITETGASPFGAAVAWNGRVDIAAPLQIAGDVIQASAEVIVGTAPGALTIAGSLRSGGAIDGALDFDVAGDAFVAGSIRAHDLVVAGELHTADNASIEISGVDDAPRRFSSAITIEPTCGCDADASLDIAAVVDAARDDNDNARIGLDVLSLQNAQATRTLALPCGRYYVESISGASDIQLLIDGQVALFVDGDIALEHSLTVTVMSGALDLIVAGNVTIADALAAGDQTAPVRLYAGGSGTLDLSRNAEVGGLVYAPRAELLVRESLRTWGPIFVRRISSDGQLNVHYDASLFDPDAPLCL